MSTSDMNMRSRIIYKDRNFQGNSYECSSNCADVLSYLSRCHSCRVESGCIVAYDRTNFTGNQDFLMSGKYAHYMNTMEMSDCIRSWRMVPMAQQKLTVDGLQYRGSYMIRIYENFGGQRSELMEDCDSITERLHMSSCMSCCVVEGHWLMYEQPHFRSRVVHVRPGEYRSLMNMGNMRFLSPRRIMDSYY